MPRDNVYKITSITCNIDSTSLWNIRAMNVVKVVNNQGYKMITNVGAGYYTIDELCNAIADSIAINDNNQTYMVSENTQSVDISGASDIANILKLKSFLIPPAVFSKPYEVIDEFEYDENGHTIFPVSVDNALTIPTSHLFSLWSLDLKNFVTNI